MNQPIDKINMTPLVSIGLILVIIFIVTSDLIMAPIDSEIQLPPAATAVARSKGNITVTLTSDSRIAVNETWIAKRDFEAVLREELAKEKSRLVVIRADKNVRHKSVLNILQKVKRCGGTHVALATEQRKREHS